MPFFDIRTTNADCATHERRTIKAVLQHNEQEKKRKYNPRIMEVEQGTFTPIVVTVKGVMGPEATRFHKTLAGKIAEKTEEQYQDVTRLIKTKLSFLVQRAALLCLRGSRTMFTSSVAESCNDFAYSLNELGLR